MGMHAHGHGQLIVVTLPHKSRGPSANYLGPMIKFHSRHLVTLNNLFMNN